MAGWMDAAMHGLAAEGVLPSTSLVSQTGAPSRRHAYGKSFPWMFDKLEKAYVLQGEATLTPDDPKLHGEAVRIGPSESIQPVMYNWPLIL